MNFTWHTPILGQKKMCAGQARGGFFYGPGDRCKNPEAVHELPQVSHMDTARVILELHNNITL